MADLVIRPATAGDIPAIAAIYRPAVTDGLASFEYDPPGEADMRFASMYVASRFDCLSLGLEMPFKDNANRPDEAVGWSPERCRGFGRRVLEAVLASVDSLR